MGVKVCGPEGCLIKSRVQANPAVAGDWSQYTIYLMMPGDWTSARVFCWIYDVASIELEADGTSSLITLTMNANSPTLTSAWTKFFIGFDNIAEHVAAGNTDNYKVGVVPGEGTSDTCIMDTNAVSPPESPSRVLPRKQRRQALRQALKQQRLAQSSTGTGNGHRATIRPYSSPPPAMKTTRRCSLLVANKTTVQNFTQLLLTKNFNGYEIRKNERIEPGLFFSV